MMKDPDNHDDVEKTVRIEVDPDDSGEFAEKTVRIEVDPDDSGEFAEKTVRFERGPDAGSPDKADSYFGEHISSDTGRKLNAALERTGQYSSGDENAGEAGDGEPGGESGPGGPGLGELISEVCRNIVSGLVGTKVLDWNETIYEENEPIDPVATDDEVSGENFDVLDRHVQLQDEIARGGQACINRGFDRRFHRVIAVKSLHDKLKEKQDYRRAFISEAKVTAQLEHPAIIPVYGIYEDGREGLHLTMKLVRGRTLKEYLERARLHYRKMSPPARRRHERTLLWKRLDIFQRVCEAIAYVHYRNVIHRDLKPENIMIGNFNETYVMDWGIAEYQKQSNSTWSGKIAGTLQYIAPEIINKWPYDERSDIFLLGLILYEIVFMKQAYAHSKTKEEAIYKAQHCIFEPFTHHFKCRVDNDLKMIIAKALAPDPGKRYQSVKELEKDLAAFNLGNEVSANPDTIFDKLLRKVRLHYKMLLFFCLVLMFSFTALIALALYREVDYRRLSSKKDRAMAEIYSRGLYSCSRFDRQFRNYEYLLSTIAGEAALLSKADKIQNLEPQVYTLQDLTNPETAPPDFAYSPVFQEKVSLDYAMFIYPEAPKPPSPKYVNMMNVLHLLKDSLRAAVVNSLPTALPEDADAAAVNHIIRHVSKPSITWVYAGFSNGLYIAYPPRADFSTNYDPRERGWYVDALKSPRHAIWSSPYVDTGERKEIVITCSQAILDDYKQPIGVAGADISLSQLLEILNETGNNGKFVKNKFLVDETGRIIADSSGELLATRVGDDQLKFSRFPYAKFLPQMWEEKNGWMFSVENGVNYLYFYLEIESLQWLYIERIDFDQLLELY